MIPGDDPTPWDLLHDGTLVAIVRTGNRARLTIRIPFLRARFEAPGDAFVVELHGLEVLGYLPYSDRWDEPLITDLAAIVAAKPNLVEAEWRPDRARALDEAGPAMIVWGGLGSLRLAYAELELALDDGRPVTLAELGEAVARYWQDWREHWKGWEVHPLVHAATREPWTAELLAGLIEAWRTERTSDLAEAIAIIDKALRDPAPLTLTGEADVAPWCASWASTPGAALAELARRASATWDILLGEGDLAYREREQANQACWDQLRRCVAALAEAPADPRIGRTIEAMLRAPSNHWFRVDQVHHVIDRFDPPADQVGVPSFADHALALLDVHGDAGSVGRLRELARRMLIEADCNEVEMSDRLATLAERLASRWPKDRALPSAVEQSLRHPQTTARA